MQLIQRHAVIAAIAIGTGCEGVQSALAPAGHSAERTADLFWWMTGAAAVIWAGVTILLLYVVSAKTQRFQRRTALLLIIGGGTAMPVVALTVLLCFGLPLIPEMLAIAPEGSLRVSVTGEQWWWRVQYVTADGSRVDLANEIRLPLGEPTEFRLTSADVIHSFWIPSLAGKVDMFPGRQTRLRVDPKRAGTFRAACAEYCGASHAHMNFYTMVTSRIEFDRWLAAQARDAVPAREPASVRGEQVFLSHGCPACHAVRGTPARGVIGPDLTHVGGRLSLGAARLANRSADFENWLTHVAELKPGAHMPEYRMLSVEKIRDLSSYLEALQ